MVLPGPLGLREPLAHLVALPAAQARKELLGYPGQPVWLV